MSKIAGQSKPRVINEKKNKTLFYSNQLFYTSNFFSSWTKLGHLFQGLIHILKSSFIYSTSINEKMFFFSNKTIKKFKKFFIVRSFFIVINFL